MEEMKIGPALYAAGKEALVDQEGYMTWPDGRRQWVPNEHDKLRCLLAAGTWSALGVRTPLTPKGRREPIPSRLCHLIAFDEKLNEAVGDGLKYTDVVVRSNGTSKSTPTAGAENRTRQWLVGEMKANPIKPHGKSYYEAAAKKKCGCGIRAFGRAWANAIAETGAEGWAESGRPSKSKRQNQNAKKS